MKKFKITLKAFCIGAVVISALTAGTVVIAKSIVKNDDMLYKVTIEDSDGIIHEDIPIGIGIRGDADSDNKVSVRDASLIARYLSQASVNSNYMPEFEGSLGGAMADANNDGKLSVRDAATIAKYLASTDPDKSWD